MVRAAMPGKAGHSEMDGGAAGSEGVELGEFLLRAGEADLESFGFAVPALVFGFGDAG